MFKDTVSRSIWTKLFSRASFDDKLSTVTTEKSFSNFWKKTQFKETVNPSAKIWRWKWYLKVSFPKNQELASTTTIPVSEQISVKTDAEEQLPTANENGDKISSKSSIKSEIKQEAPNWKIRKHERFPHQVWSEGRHQPGEDHLLSVRHLKDQEQWINSESSQWNNQILCWA